MAKLIFGPDSNDKIGYRTSKCDIGPEFESQIGLQISNAIFGPSSNVKIGFRLSKCNIRHQFECQNRISSVKTQYSASIRVSK